MTIHETTTERPITRTAVPSSRRSSPDGLRVPYSGQHRMRLALSSDLCTRRIVIDPAAQDLSRSGAVTTSARGSASRPTRSR